MNSINKLFLIYIFHYILLIETVKATIINALAFSVIEKTQIYTYLINNFNDYSIKNNLNITINLNLFTPKNSTVHRDEFFSVIDSFLKRRSNKYDIYFYDNIYTPKFEPNFLDLNKLLPKEHINLYKSVENYESYSYNNKLVGLPVIINYSALYSNIELLNKYNKEIPKTWDELLETGKYILKQEKIKNNTNIVIFNGLFTDNEAGSTTIIEFLHSYRDAINDPFPNFKSPNAVNALKMMKKLKNELSSDYVFQQNIENTFSDLLNGTGLFLKFNYLNLPVNKVYKATILPGHKNGISSTIVGGYNIGINSYLLKEKEEDAVKAVMYMTSKDIQRKLIIEHNCFSGINNLYNEDEVCKNKEELCEIYKNIQPIMRPTSKTNDYNKYSEKIRYYVYKYLYGNDIVDPAKMLRKIDDITRIYYISISSKDSIAGKIIAIVYILLSIIILSSSIFIFIKKYNYNFSFLSKDFWILSLLGYILLIYTSFVDLERVTPLRCHLKLFIQFICFTIVYIPIFHKLISNYPEENKISIWAKSHRYIFLSIFIFLDILINGLIFIQPYTVKTVVTIDSSKNFQKCKVGGLFSKTVMIVMVTYKILIFLWSCILLFAEWNLKSTIFDIRSCTAVYSLNILLSTILLIFECLKIRSYTTFFTIRESLIIIYVFTNYILLYVIRIVWYKKSLNDFNDFNEYYIEKIPQSSIDTTSSYLKRFSNNYELITSINNDNNANNNDNNNNKIISKSYFKILDFHYRNEIVPINKRSNKMTQSTGSYNTGIQSLRNNRSGTYLSRNHYSGVHSAISYSRIKVGKDYKSNKQSEEVSNKVSSTISNSNKSDISSLKNMILIEESDISLLERANDDLSKSENTRIINNKSSLPSKNNFMSNSSDISSSRNALLSMESDISTSESILLTSSSNEFSQLEESLLLKNKKGSSQEEVIPINEIEKELIKNSKNITNQKKDIIDS